MKKLLFILLFTPAIANSQSFTISPSSVQLWGKAEHTMKATASYKGVEAVVLYASHTYFDGKGGIYQGTYFAMFYRPVHFTISRLELRGGAGYFFRRFPTIHGQHLNFTAEATLHITKRFGVRYSHISNGFGLLNKMNPGADNIGLEVSL